MKNSRKITLLLLASIITVQAQTDIDLTLPVPTSEKKSLQKKHVDENKPVEIKRKRITSYKEMPYEELERVKNKLVESGNPEAAIKYIEQMMKLCTDLYVIGELMLETGNIFFQGGYFKKAAFVYSEFATLYPGHEKVEFALYRGVISSFNCCLSSDRDQTKTEETIVLADTFLAAPHFANHRDEVIAIRMECYNRLVESEFNVCQFYLQRGNLKAVTKRLKTIREKWLPLVPSITLTLLDFEIKVAEKQSDTELATLKLAEQLEYMTSSGITIAQNSKKTRFIDRF
jgi:outer membrane assembly lipoprotein YfiO